MLIGFFVSRAMLSMSMMLFGLNGLLGIHPKRWLREKWWLLGVYWVGFYLLSGLWSHDMDYWYTRCEVKLPILLLPLAFAFTASFSTQQLRLFTLFLNAVLLYGVGYSLSFLVIDPEFYIKGYDYSNVLPTLPKDDHIVFSLSMAIAVAWNVYFFPFLKRSRKILLVVPTIIFIVMLHVLAARTGLVCLYLFALGWGVYSAFRKSGRILGLTLLVGCVAGAFLGVKYVPTLQNRLDHFKYTILMFQEGNMSGDYSDIGRYMSYDLALKLIDRHPWQGVGAGNMLDSMKGAYDVWYPHVPEKQRLLPHNQFLSVALAGGLPAMLFFIAWVFYPLFEIKRTREGFFFAILWLMVMVPLMVEPVLEIQFGVFVYLFFLLWMRHMMLAPSEKASAIKEQTLTP